MVGLGVRLPVLFAGDGQANLAVAVHIGVVDPGYECHRGGLQRVVPGEADAQFEGPVVVGRLLLYNRRVRSVLRQGCSEEGSPSRFPSLPSAQVPGIPCSTYTSITNGDRWICFHLATGPWTCGRLESHKNTGLGVTTVGSGLLRCDHGPAPPIFRSQFLHLKNG